MPITNSCFADAFLKSDDISEKDRAFYQGKINTANFAVANLLPEVDAVVDMIAAWDRSIIEISEGSS